MSNPEPFDPEANDADIFYYVTHQLISAQSSLNMESSPIKDAPPDAIFLADTEEWAAHCMKHLHAAFDAISKWQKFNPGDISHEAYIRWIEETEDMSDDVKNEKGLSRKLLKVLSEYAEMKSERGLTGGFDE